MGLRQIALAGFAMAILSTGCSSSLETFRCESNADCDGQLGGICETEMVCSFADLSCEGSGQRFGDASGSLSNQCVGAADAPDAADVVPPAIDASTPVIDASLPDAEPVPPDAGTDAMIPGCVNLVLTVTDEDGGDDVELKVNGAPALICAPPSPTPPATQASLTCIFCMPIGADIDLKARSGAHLDSLITDCSLDCANNDTCGFVASVTCEALFEFDL